jgi:hypothetical protein
MVVNRRLALGPWNVLAGAKLRTDAEEMRRRQSGRMFASSTWERNEDEKRMSNALEEVAKQVGAEHIAAGEWDQIPNFHHQKWTHGIYSCHRISFPKDTLFVPNCRRPQGGTGCQR